MQRIDILAFGAHPDDVECAAAGIVLNATAQGKKVVLVDITKGEMGSHGTPEQRTKESKNAAKILGVTLREQLGFMDGNIINSFEHQLPVIQLIRKYQPRILLANALSDRHPDHQKAGRLVADAAFLSGLKKINTVLNNKRQEPWRPTAVYHYIQDYFIQPSVVVDISKQFSKKMKSIKAYTSQFKTATDKQPNGILALLKQIEATNQIFGRAINVAYAEGLVCERYIGVNDITHLC